MATTLFLLSFGFNVRRSDEFPRWRRTHGVRQGKADAAAQPQ
jgi:hypothetical protein